MTPLNRLSFQHLLYLQALVEERHVTRAADRMGIGQPAMSTALAGLRLLFRDVLLVKTSTGMEPTPRALELVKRIRELAHLMEGRGLAGQDFDPASSQAQWRILSSDGISRVVFPALMATAGLQAPEMAFTVQPGDPRRMSEHLREGDFDLALAFIRTPPPGLRQMVLYPQRLTCIVREGHPAIQGSLTLEQFIAQKHVRWGAPPVTHATMEVMLDEVLEDMGHARSVSLLVGSLPLLPGIVAGSDLVAVVPEQLARSAKETMPIQVLPIPFEVPRVDVSMLWHDRMHNDPAHKWLRDTLRDIGKQLSATLSGA